MPNWTTRSSPARNELIRQEAERTRLKQERGELYDELHRQEVACARAEAQLKAVEDERAGACAERFPRPR